MKTLKFIFAIFILSCIFASTVNAQAIIVKDKTWIIFGYRSYDAQDVVTPAGTVNLRINFLFNLNDPYIVQAIIEGPYILQWYTYSKRFGWLLCDVTFFPNGRVKVNGHGEPSLTYPD